MRQIKLSQGLFALVNDEDFDFVNQWKWHASQESRKTKWYAVRFEVIDGFRWKFRMHVEIVKHRGVYIPEGFVVDHVNHNSLDNRFSIQRPLKNGEMETLLQLEVVSQRENMLRSQGWKRKGVKCKPSVGP